MPTATDVHLIAAGKYHDIDFARLELLKLLAEAPELRTSVANNFGDTARLADCALLITYTCDLLPSASEVAALEAFLERGGRWLALHGTNSILRFDEAGKVTTPDEAPALMALLGTRFIGHPPIAPFKVRMSQNHELTAGLRDFSTVDELYLCDVTAEIDVLMNSVFDGGECPDFERQTFPPQDVPILYLRSVGKGAVLYCSLGHCRGHYDLRPLSNYWPHPQRCSWDYPIFREILRRGIQWGVGDQG
ncbi:MAG: ThuA domain-containing protein [Sphingomicrobium sp.]